MSLESLEPGTFSTLALRERIDEELLNIEQLAMADESAGRGDQARRKQWLADAVREYMRLTDNELRGRRASVDDVIPGRF